MKRIKSIGKISVCLLVLTFLMSVIYIPANAGSNVIETDIVSRNSQFNVADWYNPNDDAVFENNTLKFTEESTEETRIVSKSIAALDEHFKELISSEARFTVKALPAGQKLIIALGLDSIDAMYGEEGNAELHIKNEGGIKASLVEYTADGEKTLVAYKGVPINLNSADFVEISVSSEGVITVKINGTQFCSVKLSEAPEGRIGFMQTGECVLDITRFTSKTYSYDEPENINFTEDFEGDGMNINAMTSVMIRTSRNPGSIKIEEHDGNKVMMFNNVGLGYLGTVYPYSNFEFSFDVPYILRENIYDSENNIIAKPSGEFGISFGDIAADFTGEDYSQSNDIVLFTNSSVQGWFTKWKEDVDFTKFFTPDTNEGYSVKFSVIDSKVIVHLKKLKDTEWTKVLEHNYSSTRSGQVKIWSTRDANFSVDNIKMINLDAEPKLKEVDFKSGTITQADYDYQPQKTVYRPVKKEKEKKEFNWVWIEIICAAVGVAAIGAGAVFYGVRRKKQSEDKR